MSHLVGMVAAEATFDALTKSENNGPLLLKDYPERLRTSWVIRELYEVRNIRPSWAKAGMFGGLVYGALDSYIFKGKTPW